MRQHGARRGYRIDHIVRQFDASHDFADFDYIVVMDDENYSKRIGIHVLPQKTKQGRRLAQFC